MVKINPLHTKEECNKLAEYSTKKIMNLINKKGGTNLSKLNKQINKIIGGKNYTPRTVAETEAMSKIHNIINKHLNNKRGGGNGSSAPLLGSSELTSTIGQVQDAVRQVLANESVNTIFTRIKYRELVNHVANCLSKLDSLGNKKNLKPEEKVQLYILAEHTDKAIEMLEKLEKENPDFRNIAITSTSAISTSAI